MTNKEQAFDSINPDDLIVTPEQRMEELHYVASEIQARQGQEVAIHNGKKGTVIRTVRPPRRSI